MRLFRGGGADANQKAPDFGVPALAQLVGQHGDLAIARGENGIFVPQVLFNWSQYNTIRSSHSLGDMGDGERVNNGTALTRLQEEHGVNVRQWNEEQLAFFEENWNAVAEELQGESEIFAEAWAALQEFRTGYNVWKENAYLK